MLWNCIITHSGKCEPEPDWNIPPTWTDIKDAQGNIDGKVATGGTCKLTPDTCGRFTSEKQLAEKYKEFHGTGIHKANEEPKAKPKKKKVEQGTMF